MPSRIQLSRKKGFRLPRDAVSVARPGRWGNPFKVGDKPPFGSTPMTAEQAVKEYKRYLDANPQIVARVKRELRGRSLACWCPLTNPDGTPNPHCHAELLLTISNYQIVLDS